MRKYVLDTIFNSDITWNESNYNCYIITINKLLAAIRILPFHLPNRLTLPNIVAGYFYCLFMKNAKGIIAISTAICLFKLCLNFFLVLFWGNFKSRDNIRYVIGYLDKHKLHNWDLLIIENGQTIEIQLTAKNDLQNIEKLHLVTNRYR